MTEKSRQEENSKTTDAAGGQGRWTGGGRVRQGGKHQERVAQTEEWGDDGLLATTVGSERRQRWGGRISAVLVKLQDGGIILSSPPSSLLPAQIHLHLQDFTGSCLFIKPLRKPADPNHHRAPCCT